MYVLCELHRPRGYSAALLQKKLGRIKQLSQNQLKAQATEVELFQHSPIVYIAEGRGMSAEHKFRRFSKSTVYLQIADE
jgi:hypothetical protein